MLLEAGADPDKEDSEGMTALAYGIISGNIEVINLLAPVTTAGVDQIIIKLAQSSLNIEGELEKYLRKINDDAKMNLLLEKSSLYGNDKLLDFLLNKSNHVWSEDAVRKALENAIKTDKGKPVQTLQEYCKKKNFPLDSLRPLFGQRGMRNVAKVLGVPLSKAPKHKYNILEKVPKSEEFDYAQLMKQMCTLVQETYPTASGKLIGFETLIKHLHAQIVHYKGKHLEENKCPDNCSQKTDCRRIRDVLFLLDQIVKKMSDEFPIFKDVISIVVGSLKEQTKIGKIDESDVLLVWKDEKYKKYFEFEYKQQKLLVKKRDYQYNEQKSKWVGVDLELPDELRPFVTEEGTEDWYSCETRDYYGYFDTTKYFITFMEQFYKTIESGTLSLPKGLKLSTKFVPCEVCKNEDYKTPLYVRCRHDPGCEEHAKKKDDPNYKESCQCRNFTSPCLSWSKIGVVLHLEFVNDDGSVLNLDVDVSPPSIQVDRKRNWRGEYVEPPFDGSNAVKRAWLEQMRMPGWLTEWIKTEDMSEGATDDDQGAVRLRFINPEEVIAERTILFLDENTLKGNKLLVYIVMKILKKCTDAKLQSFKMKFAVHNALANARYENEDVGTSLDRVLRYWTVRDKFNGVEETLANIGVKRVEVKEDGLLFVMDN